jgi:Ran GTPase-activating protein (RanGAP) involved in mRNA processing and transport
MLGSDVASAAAMTTVKNSTKPGELSDGVASKFWSTSFLSSTKSVPFNTFVEKFIKYMKDQGQENVSFESAMSLRSCQRRARHTIIGNATEIAPAQLQDLIDESPSRDFPAAVLNVFRDSASAQPPFDSAFTALLEETSLSDKAFAAHVLRDIGLSLHNACKEPTVVFHNKLVALGLSTADAETLAHRVFQEARMRLPVVVRAKTKLELAQLAIEELDDDVDMSNCVLTVDSAKPLFELLAEKQHARLVDLTGNNLHADGGSAVVQLMRSLPRLTELRLSGNMLQLSGIAKVLDGALACPQLRTLDLSCSHGQPESAELVASVVAQTRIANFYFNGNDLGAKGAQMFARRLSECSKLERLALCANAIGDEGFAVLAATLATLPRLTSVELRRNGITDAGITKATKSLAACRCLLSLDLRENQETHHGINALMELAATLPTCTNVAVSDPDGARVLLNCTRANADKRGSEMRRLQAVSAQKWNVDDAVSWCHLVLRAPDIADAFKRNSINGHRLVCYTARAMRRDGIADAWDQARIIEGVESALA